MATPRTPAPDPDQIRHLITRALTNRAVNLRRDAAGRPNAGPRNAEHRANLRAEAEQSEALARVVQRAVNPIADLALVAQALADGHA